MIISNVSLVYISINQTKSNHIFDQFIIIIIITSIKFELSNELVYFLTTLTNVVYSLVLAQAPITFLTLKLSKCRTHWRF